MIKKLQKFASVYLFLCANNFPDIHRKEIIVKIYFRRKSPPMALIQCIFYFSINLSHECGQHWQTTKVSPHEKGWFTDVLVQCGAGGEICS